MAHYKRRKKSSKRKSKECARKKVSKQQKKSNVFTDSMYAVQRIWGGGKAK